MKYFFYLTIILTITLSNTLAKKTSLKVGDMVPDFTLVDGQGIEFTSSEYFNKQPLVIFFYPKDNSPVCTAEVCSFRDSFEEFKNLNAKIVGISTDNTISHRRFKRKHNLPYMLLSDHSKRIQKLFGITRGFFGGSKRITFITNKKGRIIYIFNNHSEAQLHTTEALKALRSLSN